MKRPLPVALAIAVAARAAPVLLGYEHYGDAPVRIEIAQRWAQAPHLWHGYLETFQYGPLHLTLLGTLVRLLGDRVVAARLLSLVSGLVGVWLLYRVAERERGREAGFWAAFGLALSPLHVQASTTGASEAPFLALLLGALLLALRERALLSALLLGAAGLVRYDGWMYVPLFGALLFVRTRDLPRALGYCAVAAAPALFWLWLNERWTGDPLAPIHHIDRDHAMLARTALASSGPLRARLEGLFYWPWAVCVVATPVLGLLGLWGCARAAWRREAGWELVAIAWLPAAWLTFRAAVLLDFRPMARFTLVAAALSLVFAGETMALVRGPVRALAATAAAATPIVLAALCWNRADSAAEWARPLAPIGSLPPGIAEAAHWLAANTAPADAILLDGSPYYLDILLAFASRLPEERWIRFSWKDDFEQRLARHTPSFAVLIVRGPLGDFTRDRFDYRGLHFCAARRYTSATVYRGCAPGPTRP